MRFRRVRDGHYVGAGNQILELIRGLDDSDGCEIREWQVWTEGRGQCVAITSTLNEAKTRARAFDR